MLERIVWLIPVLPLLGSLCIAASYLFANNRGEAGETFTRRLALAAMGLSLVVLLLVDILIWQRGTLPGQVQLAPWFGSGRYQVFFSFLLDGFGLAMTHLVALLSLLTLRFSVNYLHREAGYQRFFMILSLFSGAMLLIVMAGNPLLTFVGWELAGVSSYLLIAYSYERPTAARNATRAFVTNRVGDAAFMVAIVLSFFWANSIEWPSIFDATASLDRLNTGLILSGFLLAAMAKSAQVPFVRCTRACIC